MDDMENKVRSICEMKETLMTATKAKLAEGVACVDYHEMGAAIDMIKDLAEAEKSCLEACYYKTVVEAMKEGEDDEPLLGYTKPKIRANLRYKPMVDQEPYVDQYIERRGGRMMDDMRMGYPDEMPPRYDMREKGEGEHRYGKAYREYQTARRHYTTSNSPTDKEEMTTHANEHVADTIATIRDIWRTADPDLKKRMKADFSNLLSEMVV